MRYRIGLLVFMILLTSARVLPEKTTLYIGALFELSNHWYQSYVNFFIDIIEYVFEEVENRTDILADYSLKLVTKDTQGNNGLAAKRLFELMTEGPPIAAVLGPTLSYELTVVGQITPFYNVLQLSYIALTSTTLTRDFFPTLFMVNQMLDDLNPLRIKMMQFFNWERVGTIYFQNDIYASNMNKFHDLLKVNNMTLLTTAAGSLRESNIKVLVSRLKHYDVRIIFGSFSDMEAPSVFCEAYKQGMYGSNYVWILVGPLIRPAFSANGPEEWGDYSGCTVEQVKEASNGYLTLSYDTLDAQNCVTINGKTSSEVSDIIRAKVAETPYKLSSYFGWVYDTAWSVALGLNHSLTYLNESGLTDYRNNPYYLDAVLKGMHDVHFHGISGPVSFDEFGKRDGVTYIEYNTNFTRSRVAMYNHETDTLTWFAPPTSLWPGGSIPRDSFTYSTHMVPPNIPSLVLVAFANSVCMMVAIGFLAFNLYYRHNSNIKLSSPKMNNLIIAGSIVMYVVVFLTALDYSNSLKGFLAGHVCMVRVWIMCLGFTCLFGALFSKTWRVHMLFRDQNLKKKTIKDFHLFGIVILLLMLDCIVLVAWSFSHALYKHSFSISKQDPNDQNNIISEVYTYCHNDYEGYWFISMYIYKGLLLAFGTFLSWETRHVVVPALNDSKYIGFCIYNVVIVCIFGVPLTHVLPTEETTLNFVLPSTLIMFCTTLCLCLLFVPKIRIRHQVSGQFLDPSLNAKTGINGTSLGQKPKASGSGSDRQQNSSSMDDKYDPRESSPKLKKNDSASLEKEITRRRMKVEVENIEIERLKRLLLDRNNGTDDKRVTRDCKQAWGENNKDQELGKVQGINNL